MRCAMNRRIPSPETTLVVLLGASEWPHSSEFQSSEAFVNSAKEYKKYLRRIVILDCCFSAAAFKSFQSAPSQVAVQQSIDAFKEKGEKTGFPERGTALLCSSGPKVPSLISRDGKYTMFSEAFLNALT